MSEKGPKFETHMPENTEPQEPKISQPEAAADNKESTPEETARLDYQEAQRKAADQRKIDEIRAGLGLETVESKKETTEDLAREIMGNQLLGTDELREQLGIELGHEDIPHITFTREELERAKVEGAKLILRVESFEDGTPITIENVMQRFPNIISGELELTGRSEEDAWIVGSAVFSKETPKYEWKLIKTADLAPGTEYLSNEAQEAFLNNDFEDLLIAIDRMNALWDSKEIVNAGPPREMIDAARKAIPNTEKLKTLRESLPAEAKLPRAIEIIYDYLLSGKKPATQDLEIATSSTIEAGRGEPMERPIDIGFTDEGIKIHSRRDMRWGRPNALGDKKPGIAIGYIQY